MSKFMQCSKCGEEYFYTEDHECEGVVMNEANDEFVTNDQLIQICRKHTGLIVTAAEIELVRRMGTTRVASALPNQTVQTDSRKMPSDYFHTENQE